MRDLSAVWNTLWTGLSLAQRYPHFLPQHPLLPNRLGTLGHVDGRVRLSSSTGSPYESTTFGNVWLWGQIHRWAVAFDLRREHPRAPRLYLVTGEY
jgi:hypothetical protein